MPLWRFNYRYSVWECVRSHLYLYFMRVYFIRVDSCKKRLRGKAAPEEGNISVSIATDYWIAPPKINPKGWGTTFCFFGWARTSPTSRRSASSSFWSSTSQLILNISLKNVSRGLEKIFQIILKFNKCFSSRTRFPIGFDCGFIWWFEDWLKWCSSYISEVNAHTQEQEGHSYTQKSRRKQCCH